MSDLPNYAESSDLLLELDIEYLKCAGLDSTQPIRFLDPRTRQAWTLPFSAASQLLVLGHVELPYQIVLRLKGPELDLSGLDTSSRDDKSPERPQVRYLARPEE